MPGLAPLPKAANDHSDRAAAARERRAKVTRAILIFMIVILFAVLIGIIYLGYRILIEEAPVQNPLPGVSSTTIDAPVSDNRQPEAPVAKTMPIPLLVSFFGLDVAAVEDALGKDYALVKTEPVSDEAEPDVKSLVTLSYMPQASSTASASAQGGALAGGASTSGAAGVLDSGLSSKSTVQNIYLSLDGDGRVIGVYFASAMELLGYQQASFASYVRSEDMVRNLIRSCGAEIAADFVFNPPDEAAYTVYVDPQADVKRMRKESAVFEGGLVSADAPTGWHLTMTYDYGVTGAAPGSDAIPDQRMIYINLE